MIKSDLLMSLREIQIIYKEPVLLRSGVTSDFYCDIKEAFGYPEVMNKLADAIGEKLSPNVTCVAASGYGGLPIASLVASRFSKKFTAVRDNQKKHGKGGLIDGYVPDGSDVVTIVDDVLTSGSSITETFNILCSQTNAKLLDAIVIVKRGNAELAIPYKYLFTVEEILNS